MGMKKLSLILPVRENLKAFYDLMYNISFKTLNLKDIEILVAIDYDDEIFMDCIDLLKRKFGTLDLQFFPVSRSDHFTKDYWSFLAKKARGRFIIPIALGCQINTPSWDNIVYKKMDEYAREVGDDIIHGLIKDNIRRTGEDPLYPNFSCHPVLSKEHVDALGYFFDERYWAWGSDQAVTIVYKELFKFLKQRRIVSLIDVEIVAVNSIHTSGETDETKLKIMRELDRGYQHFLRIDQEHQYSMTPQDAKAEAIKLFSYITNKRNVHNCSAY
jgi:hypothetical protein